jgi:hypothetical protein
MLWRTGALHILTKAVCTSYGEPVKVYAFVSGTFDDTDWTRLLHLNALRISETNYRKFLSRWVRWLKSVRVSK